MPVWWLTHGSASFISLESNICTWMLPNGNRDHRFCNVSGTKAFGYSWVNISYLQPTLQIKKLIIVINKMRDSWKGRTQHCLFLENILSLPFSPCLTQVLFPQWYCKTDLFCLKNNCFSSSSQMYCICVATILVWRPSKWIRNDIRLFSLARSCGWLLLYILNSKKHLKINSKCRTLGAEF